MKKQKLQMYAKNVSRTKVGYINISNIGPSPTKATSTWATWVQQAYATDIAYPHKMLCLPI